MNVRKSALRAMNRCLSVAILLGAVLILASAQGGGTEEEERAFLALQRPEIFDIGQEFVEVEFFSGPNLVSYQYSVACYLAQDAVTCADVVGGGTTPLDSVTGSLPRGYSRVLANMTVPDNTDVDCFVTVGGGPLSAFSKCQIAGEDTTDPLPVPKGYTVEASSVPGQPDALLVKAELVTSRDALLASLFPEEAVSLSRNYEVTYKVQCLPDPATACDPSQTLVDGEDLFTTGTLVTGLIPNTDYQCFVLVEFDGQTRCTSADATDVVPTLPEPPTDVTVSSPAFESLDVAAVAPTGPSGDAVPVAGYAFQCSLAPECDPSGTWFPSSAPFASDPATPVTVSGLDPDTQYNCWAATVAGDSAPYEYFCSDSEQGSTPAPFPPTLAAIPGSTPNEVEVTASVSNAGTTLKVACVPTASLPTCPDATGAGITWTPASDNTPLQIGTTVDGTAMVGGTSYTCYAAEFVGTDYRVCSAGSPVVAQLNPPTVATAVPGTNPGEIVVTPTAPTTANVDTTLNVACVAVSAGCPTDATAFTGLTAGSGTITGLDGGEQYDCFAAEISVGAPSIIACSAATTAVAALNAPTGASAVTGRVSGSIDVTPSAPSTANVATTLNVACVAGTGTSCPTLASSFTAAAAGSATTITGLTGGAAYECYAAEISTTDASVIACSGPSSATANSLIAPTLSAEAGPGSAIDVTPSAGQGGTLRVGCVVVGSGCPLWAAASTAADATRQTLSTLADGSSTLMASSTDYDCYAIEQDGGGEEICSSIVTATSG